MMGHQLDTCKKLNRWELLNEDKNQRAKDYWQQTVAEREILSYAITGSMWPVFIDKAKVITNFKPFLYDSIHGAKLGQYWVEMKRFSDDDLSIGRLEAS